MATGMYTLHDLYFGMMSPMRNYAEMLRNSFQSPTNPFSFTPVGRMVAGSADNTYRLLKNYPQPKFGIKTVTIKDKEYRVREKHPMNLPFCRLKHFEVVDDKGNPVANNRPKLLIGAPLSGHYSTLLRDTVTALLPHHDVYITDWKNAREVPLSEGYFDLDDCVEYYMNFLRELGPNVHILGVCQPSVPVLIAVTMLNKLEKHNAPRSMILMGGPVDTRINPTEVNKLAMTRPLEWFERNAIGIVPPWYQGAMRQVYPGFMQLTGFVSMNIDRHIDAHFKYFQNTVNNDQKSTAKHRKFYDEYLAVMDITAEFYLQTVDRVFQSHLLPKGEYIWRKHRVDLGDITDTAMLIIEGELDDITAVGQSKVTLDLSYSLPPKMEQYHLQKQAGHYGLFSGSRWRNEVRPVVTKFIHEFDGHTISVPKKKVTKSELAKKIAKKYPPKRLSGFITPLVETAAIIG